MASATNFTTFLPFYKPGDSLPKEGHILGNFFEASQYLLIDGKPLTFQTAEAAYQARSKGTTFDEKKRFTEFKTGEEAYKYGQILGAGRGHHPDSYAIMFGAVFAKFSQNPHLTTALLETGTKYLVEHPTPRLNQDLYWSDGGDGTGQNMLGRILMTIRGNVVGPTTEYFAWLAAKKSQIVPVPVPISVPAPRYVAQTLSGPPVRVTICEKCMTRQVYVDPKGKVSKWCSIKCRNLKFAEGTNCEVCKIKKVYADEKTISKYCSRKCQTLASGPCIVCRSKPVHVGTNGQPSLCCSRTCLSKLCKVCKKAPVYKDSAGNESPCCSRTCLRVLT